MTPSVTIIGGDCLDQLASLPDSSVDSIVTDPPYGLSNTDPAKVAQTLAAWVSGDDRAVPTGRGFMGQAWDAFVPPPAVWKECMRVLKPGGHMAVFAGSRTQDLMGLSIRLAGFEIRDSLAWLYGSGFPKGTNVSKGIDRKLGVEREVVGTAKGARNGNGENVDYGSFASAADGTYDQTASGSDEARKWEGWNSALKPAQEPVILARKPLEGTLVDNVLAHGTGAINVDATRVSMSEDDQQYIEDRIGGFNGTQSIGGKGILGDGETMDRAEAYDASKGRYPANVLLDEGAAAALDEQTGILAVAGNTPDSLRSGTDDGPVTKPGDSQVPTYAGGPSVTYADRGGASRFFPVFKYQSKAPKRERPVVTLSDGTVVKHPTVKPLALMDWLVTLITPPGGTVLDPFAGSGATLQAARDGGFSSIGIEAHFPYVQLILERLGEH